MSESFIVAVRIRPPSASESSHPLHRSIIRPISTNTLVFDPPSDLSEWGDHPPPLSSSARSTTLHPSTLPSSSRHKDLRYAFDHVFPPSSTQSDVYQRTAWRVIPRVLDGYNATVFAYGATGCGKTHTMIGTAAQPGIMVHTVRDLFAGIEARPAQSYQLTLAYLEVYNEQIRDLLSPLPTSTQLGLREERDGSMTIAGLTTHSPASSDEVFRMLERGNARRTQSSTEANAQSSRSHAVLQVVLRMKERDGDRLGSRLKVAKLSLIDLAGSERAAVSKNRGQTLKEGANINRSLLALGNCINQLAAKSSPASAAATASPLSPPSKASAPSTSTTTTRTAAAARLRGKENQQPPTATSKILGRGQPPPSAAAPASAAPSSTSPFVPYRDSKLTRLLKDSLGGNTLTVMICNVSASSLCAEDSHNTLKYANRAKDIKTRVERNERTVGWHVAQYEEVMREMRREVEEWKAKWAEAVEASKVGGSGGRKGGRGDGREEEGEGVRRKAEGWKERLLARCREREEVERRVARIKSSLVKLGGVMAIEQDEVDCWQQRMGGPSSAPSSNPPSPPSSLTSSLTSHHQQRASLLTALQHSSAQLHTLSSSLTSDLTCMRTDLTDHPSLRAWVDATVQSAIDRLGLEVARATTDLYSEMVAEYRQRVVHGNQVRLQLLHALQAVWGGGVVVEERRGELRELYQQAMAGAQATPPTHRWYDTLTEDDRALLHQLNPHLPTDHLLSPSPLAAASPPPPSPPPPPAESVSAPPPPAHRSIPSTSGELHFRYQVDDRTQSLAPRPSAEEVVGKSSMTGRLFEYGLTSRSTVSKQGTLVDPLVPPAPTDDRPAASSPTADVGSSPSASPSASSCSPASMDREGEEGHYTAAASPALSRLSSLSTILTTSAFSPGTSTPAAAHRRGSSSFAFRSGLAGAAAAVAAPSSQWMATSTVDEGDAEAMDDDVAAPDVTAPPAPAPIRGRAGAGAVPALSRLPSLLTPSRSRLPYPPLAAPAVSVLPSLPFAHHRSPSPLPLSSERPPSSTPSLAPQVGGGGAKGCPVLGSPLPSPAAARLPASKYQRTRQGRREMEGQGGGEEQREDSAASPAQALSATQAAHAGLGKLISPSRQVQAGLLSSKSRLLFVERADGASSIPRYTPLKSKRPLEKEWRAAGPSPLYRRP